MKRPLPTAAEAAAILAARRTRPARSAPPTAGRKLVGLVKALDARFGQGVGGLSARWREIVGEPVARASEPVRLIKTRSGPLTLEIKVDGPAAALIQHQSPAIIERANLVLGAGAVGRLRIVQGPVRRAPDTVRTPARPGPRRKPPLDAAAEAALQEGLAQVEDDKLRHSLAQLGRHVLRASSPR